MDHPSVVRYVAHGKTSASQTWLALEWLSGETFAARLDRGPLDVPSTLELAARLLAGLVALHARGVVHRDVTARPAADASEKCYLSLRMTAFGGALYDVRVRALSGEEQQMAAYADKVLLIVNTASQCMFTPQYEKLETLHQRYKSRGLSVLAFPCNQFGQQEPGTNDEIKSFCETYYRVTFPLFDKIEVNGEGAHPLFVHLKDRAPGIFGTRAIKWNFTKFLVSRGGREVQRFAPVTTPQEIREELELML